MINLYSSSLYSALTVPQYELSIDTIDQIEQIANTDSRFIIFVYKSTVLQHALQSQPSDRLMYSLRQHYLRTNMHVPRCHNCERQPSINRIAYLVDQIEQQPKVVGVNTGLVMMAFGALHAHKSLHMSRESLWQDYIAIVARKHSPLIKLFNKLYVCKFI